MENIFINIGIFVLGVFIGAIIEGLISGASYREQCKERQDMLRELHRNQTMKEALKNQRESTWKTKVVYKTEKPVQNYRF